MLKSGSAETTPLRARSNRCAYTDPPAALWRLLSTPEYISVTSCLIVFGSFSQTFSKFQILSRKPETLFIKGLSSFLSDAENLSVKIVSKDVVLFKSIDKKKNYSESGIITRKTGELIHEITRNIKSENAEKYISIYSCIKHDQKV